MRRSILPPGTCGRVMSRVSFEQFLAHPDLHYYDFDELHDGDVVTVSPPTEAHVDLQERIERLLRSVLRKTYIARREFYIRYLRKRGVWMWRP